MTYGGQHTAKPDVETMVVMANNGQAEKHCPSQWAIAFGKPCSTEAKEETCISTSPAKAARALCLQTGDMNWGRGRGILRGSLAYVWLEALCPASVTTRIGLLLTTMTWWPAKHQAQ